MEDKLKEQPTAAPAAETAVTAEESQPSEAAVATMVSETRDSSAEPSKPAMDTVVEEKASEPAAEASVETAAAAETGEAALSSEPTETATAETTAADTAAAEAAAVAPAPQEPTAETSPMAREIAGRFDFHVFDPARESNDETLVAAVFDTVGTGKSMTAALPLLEESGTYVNLAVHGGEVTLDAALLASERTITTSSNAFYSDVAEAYKLIFSGQVEPEKMISHSLPLTEFQRAFDLLLATPKQAYKVVFVNP